CDPPRRPKVQLTVSEAILAMAHHMVKGDVKYFAKLSLVTSHWSLVPGKHLADAPVAIASTLVTRDKWLMTNGRNSYLRQTRQIIIAAFRQVDQCGQTGLSGRAYGGQSGNDVGQRKRAVRSEQSRHCRNRGLGVRADTPNN